jgi:hypothetical protein
MKTFQWTTFVLNGIEGKSDNTFLMWYYTHLKTHRQKTFECKLCSHISKLSGPSWSWSFGIWIYNYPCNQCLSPLMLWVWVPLMMRCTTLCDKVCQWLAAGWWFSLGTLVSSTNKADLHDITEILLKVALKNQNQSKIVQSECCIYCKLCSIGCFSIFSTKLVVKSFMTARQGFGHTNVN